MRVMPWVVTSSARERAGERKSEEPSLRSRFSLGHDVGFARGTEKGERVDPMEEAEGRIAGSSGVEEDRGHPPRAHRW